MDKIPAETLLVIFSHTRPSLDPDWKRPAFSVYSWITISHVCREWREVLLASPMMWDYLLMAESCSSTINTAAAAFLERSGEIPLHVSLVVGPQFQSETGASRLEEPLQAEVGDAGTPNDRLPRS